MDRVAQNSIGEVLSETWRDTAGNVVDPGTVTVTITRADGTALVSGGATGGGGAAARTFALTTTHTGQLDRLTVVWASSVYGPRTPDYVEVVGGFLFSISEARALFAEIRNLQSVATADIVAMRTTVEQALEQACARAFVPRYERETLSGDGTTSLLVKWPDVRLIRSVTVTGTAYGSIDLANVAFNPSGVLYTPLGWTAGYSNVVVGYEHGMGYVPPEVSRAALILAKMWLVGQRNPIDDRAITFNTTEGGTYSLAVPGRNGSVFGQPDVDSLVQRYSMQVGVA